MERYVNTADFVNPNPAAAEGSLVPMATYRLLPNHPRDRDVDAFNHQLGLLKDELRRCRLENGTPSVFCVPLPLPAATVC